MHTSIPLPCRASILKISSLARDMPNNLPSQTQRIQSHKGCDTLTMPKETMFLMHDESFLRHSETMLLMHVVHCSS